MQTKGFSMNMKLVLFRECIFLAAFAIFFLLLLCTYERSWAKEPAKTMQATLVASVNWEIEEGENVREGTCKLRAVTTLELDRDISGLDHNPLLTPVALQYKGATFNGTVNFNETLTQNEALPKDCSPLLERYEGTKSFSYTPDYGSIHLSVNRFGIINKQIESLASGEGAQQFLAQLLSQSEIPSSYYEFRAGGISGWHTISGQKRKSNKDGCSYVDAEKKITFSVISLRFPILENTSMGGGESWQISIDRPPRNFSMHLSKVDIGKEVAFRPDSAKSTDGSASYSVSWSLGEAPLNIPDVKVQKVFFKYTGDSHEQDKSLQLWKHGNPEKEIKSPEWVLGRSDNRPAAFVREYLFKVKAEFKSDRPVKSAKIRAIEAMDEGLGFGGVLEQVGELKISGKKIIGEFIIKTAQEKIGTHKVSWEWEGEIELEDEPGGQIKTSLGISNHTIYIVGGIPDKNVRAYEYVVNKGCEWANGTEGGDNTFWAIWDNFKDIPAPQSPERCLSYEHNEAWNGTTNELLTNEEGKCGSWSSFFKDTVGVHGIDVMQLVIKPIPPFDVLVTYPIPGQANPHPNRVFINHAVVWYGNQYFDPSYMVEPEVRLIDYENKMFKGYCRKADVDNYREARQNRLGPCAHIGADEISELSDCLIDCPDHSSCLPNNIDECEVSDE
jgi:hypothetical protein